MKQSKPSPEHRKAMDYIYSRTGCACCDDVCGCACHRSDEPVVTSDTEIDEEEVRCAMCDRTVCLYGEEIYHRYTTECMEYICRVCAQKGTD